MSLLNNMQVLFLVWTILSGIACLRLSNYDESEGWGTFGILGTLLSGFAFFFTFIALMIA